jgi:hypothetical protein
MSEPEGRGAAWTELALGGRPPFNPPPRSKLRELRSDGRATREGSAVKGEWGGGRGPAGERETPA